MFQRISCTPVNLRVKHKRPVFIYDDSAEDLDLQKKKKPPSGDPDTKFKYTKTNDYNACDTPSNKIHGVMAGYMTNSKYRNCTHALFDFTSLKFKD